MIERDQISEKLRALQEDICTALEKEDGLAQFSREEWRREGGGGGLTRVIQHGNVFEKGGVNFSEVYGELPEKITEALKISDNRFFATGVSIVIHPSNPFVPIIHMNVRYFELDDGTWWFGGGIDLTPHYINELEAKQFHETLKEVCDRHDPEYYPRFSKWADEYFFIPHRNEPRGIGGIFFDRLTSDDPAQKEKLFDFVLDVGNTFAPLYTDIVSANKNKIYDEQHRQWQYLRRGRYVEFNLVYDKGTKFGLETGGRIESILMSLPENASWIYDYQPVENSFERRTLDLLKSAKFRLV